MQVLIHDDIATLIQLYSGVFQTDLLRVCTPSGRKQDSINLDMLLCAMCIIIRDHNLFPGIGKFLDTAFKHKVYSLLLQHLLNLVRNILILTLYQTAPMLKYSDCAAIACIHAGKFQADVATADNGQPFRKTMFLHHFRTCVNMLCFVYPLDIGNVWKRAGIEEDIVCVECFIHACSLYMYLMIADKGSPCCDDIDQLQRIQLVKIFLSQLFNECFLALYRLPIGLFVCLYDQRL